MEKVIPEEGNMKSMIREVIKEILPSTFIQIQEQYNSLAEHIIEVQDRIQEQEEQHQNYDKNHENLQEINQLNFDRKLNLFEDLLRETKDHVAERLNSDEELLQEIKINNLQIELEKEKESLKRKETKFEMIEENLQKQISNLTNLLQTERDLHIKTLQDYLKSSTDNNSNNRNSNLLLETNTNGELAKLMREIMEQKNLLNSRELEISTKESKLQTTMSAFSLQKSKFETDIVETFELNKLDFEGELKTFKKEKENFILEKQEFYKKKEENYEFSNKLTQRENILQRAKMEIIKENTLLKDKENNLIEKEKELVELSKRISEAQESCKIERKKLLKDKLIFTKSLGQERRSNLKAYGDHHYYHDYEGDSLLLHNESGNNDIEIINDLQKTQDRLDKFNAIAKKVKARKSSIQINPQLGTMRFSPQTRITAVAGKTMRSAKIFEDDF